MRIAIVGAGIGGLVAAAGLQKDGHDVTVYEQRDGPAAVGAGLTLFDNAFVALDAIGLGDIVRNVSSDAIGRLRSGQRLPSGQWLVSMPPFEAPAIRSLHRVDLQESLLQQLASGTLSLGNRVTVSTEGAPVITIGEHQESFDLVVGADGIRSDARQRWGVDRGLRYAGYTAWRGVAPASGHLADAAGETWGDGARFGIVPLPDDRVYWFATLSTAPGGKDTDALSTLRQLFSSWHAPIAQLLDATPTGTVLRHDISDLAEFPTSFVHNRGVLLGDAAHAMTPDLGQGAGQAIEDAATLVLLLRDRPAEGAHASLDAALQRYDHLRRPRTRALWQQSRRTGAVGQTTGALRVGLRDTALRLIPTSLMAHAMRRVQRWAPPRP
jgi:2-polyprenyl-6-methoxyphenol hydroxylase-like FAD-dependent oxidoreductase